jgi:hypothetical protein
MARAEIPVENLQGVVDYQDAGTLTRWIIRRLDKGTSR